MSLYSYKLHKSNVDEKNRNTYKQKDLSLMSTYQLREICNKEKLVKSIVNPLDKEELIRLIMKYRGEKESLLIDRYLLGGIERIERLLKRSRLMDMDDFNIDYPSKIVLYDDLGIDIYDDYKINSNSELEESNVLVVDDNFNVCTVLNVRKIKMDNEDRYFLTKGDKVEVKNKNSKHFSLVFLDAKDSETIYKTYEGDTISVDITLRSAIMPLLQLELRPVEETAMPLAIDFGTSNTTAGIYINREIFTDFYDDIDNKKYDYEDERVKFVKIIDNMEDNAYFTPLIPSVVGVKHIIEENDSVVPNKLDNKKYEYVFGYEAMKESKKRYIDDNLSIFYDIKRWISDFEKEEKVIDIDGKSAFIKRKDIIKAYLQYIISLANQRFKCKFKNIYISCPSKQKYKFHTLFKEALSDYNVDSENMLEESVAVLYNTISDLIDKKKYSQGDEYKALIIDCGGGTTDLTGCTFSIKNNRVSYELDIETSYENGDTDFGGNNLTFRIMQFIKISMANILLGRKDHSIKALMDEFKLDIFRFVDNHGVKELYDTLDEEYAYAERIIPTKFKNYELRSKEDYCKVRSNYYFLFNLAEDIKKLFFTNPDITKILLTCNDEKHDAEKIIYDKWKLSYINKNRLEVVKEAPELVLTTYEITTLLKGDIYNIIKKFLEVLYENDELYDYSLIKLTGQSCKVDIFKDALKEFIPGRIIEINKGERILKEDYELKLSCLKGALKYLYSRNFGYADVTLKSKRPTLPYILTAFTHTGEEVTLIQGRDKTKGCISRFMDRIILKLYLKDSFNLVKYEYNYTFKNDELEKITAIDICKKFKNINQHETDNIENNEIKFFVWSEEELWGFYILAIVRHEDELYISKEKFYYFENDEWEKNFFDGLN